MNNAVTMLVSVIGPCQWQPLGEYRLIHREIELTQKHASVTSRTQMTEASSTESCLICALETCRRKWRIKAEHRIYEIYNSMQVLEILYVNNNYRCIALETVMSFKLNMESQAFCCC